MNVHKLDLSQMAAHRATHLVVITHEDLTTADADTAQVIELLPVTSKQAVRLAKVVLATPFQDASDAAFNSNLITIGDGNDADRLLASTQVNVNGTEVLLKTGPVTAASAPAAPAAVTAVVCTSPAATDDSSDHLLTNELKAEFNKAIADIAALRAAIVATQAALVSPYYVYTGDDTIDLTIAAMSAKALADIDTGELHIYLDVVNHA